MFRFLSLCAHRPGAAGVVQRPRLPCQLSNRLNSRSRRNNTAWTARAGAHRIERFNRTYRTYRTEVLNAHLFESVAELQAITDAWLDVYN